MPQRRRIVWAQSALNDFDATIHYLAERDPAAAKLTLERLDRAARSLGEYPTGRPGRVAGTYEKTVTNSPHIIAYAMDAGTISILRIIHSARHWPSDEWPDR